jgi:hypothetical protein
VDGSSVRESYRPLGGRQPLWQLTWSRNRGQLMLTGSVSIDKTYWLLNSRYTCQLLAGWPIARSVTQQPTGQTGGGSSYPGSKQQVVPKKQAGQSG